MKNQSLLADFPILQTHLFVHVMINTRHVIAGKFSAKQHGRSKCHIYEYNMGKFWVNVPISLMGGRGKGGGSLVH